MTLHIAVPDSGRELAARSHSDRVMADFRRLVDTQIGLSDDQLNALHRHWLGPQGVFACFSAQIERLGRQAPSLEDLGQLDSPQRAAQAERAIAFALAQSNRRNAVSNPFSGRTRADLCCVVFDEGAAYTLVERYAAYESMRHSDSEFFIKLIATTRGVVERRIVFRGLLEHFDRLLPVEKSIYPAAYREVQQAHLDREEALYGPLLLNEDVITLLESISPLELLSQIQQPSQAPL